MLAPTSVPTSPDAGPACHRLDSFPSGSPPLQLARPRNRSCRRRRHGGRRPRGGAGARRRLPRPTPPRRDLRLHPYPPQYAAAPLPVLSFAFVGYSLKFTPTLIRSSPQAGTWRGGRCWCTCRWCRRSPGCARRRPLNPSRPTAAASPGSTSPRLRPPKGESFYPRTTHTSD